MEEQKKKINRRRRRRNPDEEEEVEGEEPEGTKQLKTNKTTNS